MRWSVGGRRTVVVVLLVAALLGATGCRTAKVGARCRGTEFAQSGNWVLVCKKGRLVRWQTKPVVAVFLIRLLQERLKPEPGSFVRPDGFVAPQYRDTADPAVLVDGGVAYLYSTRNFRRLPVRVRPDIDAELPAATNFSETIEAMPAPVPWAADDEVWAPTVAKLGGSYVAYFSARRANPSDPANPHCIGRAVAAAPTGPFVAEPAPIHCGNDGHGALDPEVYVAPDGRVVLLAAFGGSNTNIWSIPLDGAGNVTGAPTALLARVQPWEDWFLENPSMIWDGRHYVLAYAAGRWNTAGYVTGIARCASPAGPCGSNPNGPWLASAAGRTGPGGLTFFTGADGAPRVAFHTYPAGGEAATGARATHVQRVAFDPWPRLG